MWEGEAVSARHDCWCYDCKNRPELGMQNPVLMQMIVCPICGNKRCPKATNHALECTHSNAMGQKGSRYE